MPDKTCLRIIRLLHELSDDVPLLFGGITQFCQESKDDRLHMKTNARIHEYSFEICQIMLPTGLSLMKKNLAYLGTPKEVLFTADEKVY